MMLAAPTPQQQPPAARR